MKRRTFIAGLGSAAAWPLAARAQQPDRVRRIGVLASGAENDPVYKSRVSAFSQALAGLGWTDGRNVRVDLRWAGGDNNRIRALAHELVGLQPDIIVTSGTPATAAVQQETRTIPIVFAGVIDPVATGIVRGHRRTLCIYALCCAGGSTSILVWGCSVRERPRCYTDRKWLKHDNFRIR